MQYLILDTNIYLDLVVWRDDSVPPETLTYLKTLLDRHDVKLVVPDVVQHEFNRNVHKLLKQCRDELAQLSNKVRSGIFPNVPEIEEFQVKRDAFVRELGTWKDLVSSHTTENYLIDQFNKLLDSKNVMRIVTTSSVLEGLLRRRLFKRCPCHIDGKDSDGDAVIVEVLLGLADIIDETDEDRIIFISRNFADFTDNITKDQLHPHLLEDLDKAGLLDRVVDS
jgi:hypothetical protein